MGATVPKSRVEVFGSATPLSRSGQLMQDGQANKSSHVQQTLVKLRYVFSALVGYFGQVVGKY
jgi:hypothetical protein